MAVPPVPPPPGADPSMDEILASIRKILNEDEAKAIVNEAQSAPASPAPQQAPHPDHHHAVPPTDDVLVLDETMMVPADSPLPDVPVPAVIPPPPAGPVLVEQSQQPAALPLLAPPAAGPPVAPIVDAPAPAYTPIPAPSANADPAPALVGPAAAGAASASVEALVRTLTRERATATHRGGPTIEDLVREEMRPLLKDWLDTHLPPLVERLVRAEIERLVNRTIP